MILAAVSPTTDSKILNNYKNLISGFIINGNSAIIQSAKQEITKGLGGLLGKKLEQKIYRP